MVLSACTGPSTQKLNLRLGFRCLDSHALVPRLPGLTTGPVSGRPTGLAVASKF
jgi:hypothetical protein